MAGTCECDNVNSGCIKCGEFIEKLNKTVSFSRRALLHGGKTGFKTERAPGTSQHSTVKGKISALVRIITPLVQPVHTSLSAFLHTHTINLHVHA